MNENLNLVEILKDCPKGMELDCTMYDNATFGGIIENGLYPIKVYVGDGPTMMLTKYGQYTNDDNAKCIIFPKGETTWEGFVPPHEFKDGDIVAKNTGNCIGITTGGHIYSYIPTYCALRNNSDFKLYFGGKELWKFDRLATEEERQKLFQAIKDNGYEWNAETKTLNKLVKPKPKFKVGDKIVNRFCIYRGHIGRKGVISEITEDKYILNDGGYIHIKDQGLWELDNDKKQRFNPKTLKEFDKVLVKDDGDWIWRVDIISVPADYNDNIPYLIGDNDFDWIIPYNDETKHLLGTSDEAPEFYRYWED